MTLQTVVIVDGIEILDAATAAAIAAKPDDKLIFSVYGISDCMDVPDGKGGERHVHWYSGNAADMQKGADRRKLNGVFGGFLYVTRTPDAPHVRAHCDGLIPVAGKRPQILAIS